METSRPMTGSLAELGPIRRLGDHIIIASFETILRTSFHRSSEIKNYFNFYKINSKKMWFNSFASVKRLVIGDGVGNSL